MELSVCPPLQSSASALMAAYLPHCRERHPERAGNHWCSRASSQCSATQQRDARSIRRSAVRDSDEATGWTLAKPANTWLPNTAESNCSRDGEECRAFVETRVQACLLD